MRLLVEEHMASVVQRCVILAATKSDFCRVVKSSIQDNWLHVNHYSTFLQHKNVILRGSWAPRIKDILISFSYPSAIWKH